MRKVLERLGVLGNIIAMLAMPCCFPFVISLLGFFGFSRLGLGAWTPYVVLASLLFLLISRGRRSRKTRVYRPFVAGLMCAIFMLYHLFRAGPIWLYYIGIGGVFILAMIDLFGKKISKNTTSTSACCVE